MKASLSSLSTLSEYWDNVSWFQHKPQLSLDLISSVDTQKSDAIIDVGGGTSSLVDWLLVEGYQDITVLDISKTAIERTKQRLEHKQQTTCVQFEVANITEYDSKNKYFHVWHDRAVFHFLTDPTDRTKYVSVLKNCMYPGGVLVMGTFALGGPQLCSGMNIVQYDAQKMQNELGVDFDFIKECFETHITPWGSEQSFWYGVFRFRSQVRCIE